MDIIFIYIISLFFLFELGSKKECLPTQFSLGREYSVVRTVESSLTFLLCVSNDMPPPTHLNVLCVNVKDLLRTADNGTAPQQVQPQPPQRVKRGNVAMFSGRDGKGYMVSGDSKSKPLLTPVSPADGAVLDEILSRPAEREGAKRALDGRMISVDTRPQVERFEMVLPPPKPHERGHWHEPRFSHVPSEPKMRKPIKKATQPKKSSASPPHALAIPQANLISPISRQDDGSLFPPDVSTKWVDPIELPSSADAGGVSVPSSSVPLPTSEEPQKRQGAELSEVAANILRNTTAFLERYQPTALEPRQEETTTGLPPKPVSTKTVSSRRTNEDSTDSDSADDLIPPKRRDSRHVLFDPRLGVSTRGLPVHENRDWAEPQPVPVRRRLPFQHMLNRPFEVMMEQIAYDRRRHREMNVNQFNMKSRRPRYRKVKPNLVPYGRAYNPEDSVHNIPGPFKKYNQEEYTGRTNRPKKR